MAYIEPVRLAVLLKWRNELLAQQQEIQERLAVLDDQIDAYESGSAKAELKVLPSRVEPKQIRVRGVLAAARRAIDQLSGPFDKDDLLAKLKADAEFVDKEISVSNIRNALRILKERGVIKVENEATATSCARYVKAAQAA